MFSNFWEKHDWYVYTHASQVNTTTDSEISEKTYTGKKKL